MKQVTHNKKYCRRNLFHVSCFMFHRKGFTLVEVLVSVGIISMLALVVGQIYFLIIGQITYYREQTVVTSLADQYMEVARNLPYSKIGTVSGNPSGNLADMPNPINVTINGTAYQIYYAVSYVDDPADGTILAGTDPNPEDYKQVKLYVKNTTTNYTNSFSVYIVPKGLEGILSGGALSVKVFDAVGQPVAQATIHIQNNLLGPAIDITRTTDSAGNWIEVGLPNSSNSYHITVTKNGYSSDQTYPISQSNPSPIKPDSTISQGQITKISFSIDKVSSLVFNVQDQVCSPLSGIGLEVYGAKLIGTPNILKFDNNYISNGSGQVSLANLEWDTYAPVLSSLGYMIYGTSPIQQINILPNTSQTFNMILGPKTQNSLLVIVKDSATSNPIEGATVLLKETSPPSSDSKLTGGSIWSQQDWSGGLGQVDFIDPSKYWSDNNNVGYNGIPSGLRLSYFNNSYSNSGVLTSSTFDTGTNATSYTTLLWQPTSQDPQTSVKFQIATNNDDITWNYIGPDGTANSYYTVSGVTISASNNNKRYVRYRAFLSTNNPLKTPVLTSVNINYVSGCFTPGQVIFPGLNQASDYQVTISASGYQTQTIPNLNINGYNTLQILLAP